MGVEGAEVDEGKRKQLKEKKEKKRMRGKNKSMKRYLRKHRKNVVDPATVCFSAFSLLSKWLIPLIQSAIKAKLEKMKEERRQAILVKKGVVEEKKKSSALDRFKQKT